MQIGERGRHNIHAKKVIQNLRRRGKSVKKYRDR